MNKWKTSLISPESSILEAIQIIDHSALQIALVVEEDYRLLGTITDGDIRRGILAGIALDSPVRQIMNASPRVIKADDSRENALSLMRNTTLHHIPVVDENGRVVGLECINDLIGTDPLDNPVILMAGGLGNRLRPLTEKRPKPMLNVGGKPVLETILESLIQQGFHDFYISVNYKAQMIQEYFGDGTRWGVKIRYIIEDRALGTAGSIGLLRPSPDKTLLVINGDILTKIDFRRLLTFHARQETAATVCVRDYSLQIPYGVVKLNSQLLEGIEEKPLLHFLVNAGIYVLGAETMNYIPENSYLNMTDLLKTLVRQSEKVAVFPVREYWIDIGHIYDYGRANGEYTEVFV